MPHDPGADLHQPVAQGGERPLLHCLGQGQGAQEVGEVVGQCVPLQPLAIGLPGRGIKLPCKLSDRPLVLHVHPASVQDRDGAVLLLKGSRRSFPFVQLAKWTSPASARRATRWLTPLLVRKSASPCVPRSTGPFHLP
jgi:hypothetical protein